MPLFESLVALLTSSTAKSVGRFLYQKIDGYLRSKYGAATTEEKVALKRQMEELERIKEELKRINDEIQSKIKTDTDVTQNEVDDLKQRVVDIEELQKQKKLPEVLISAELFDRWIEEEEVEDKAFVAKRELEVLIDKAREMGVRENKLWEIEDVKNALVRHVKSLREARRKLRSDETRVFAQQQEKEAIIAIDSNLDMAKALLKKYQKTGG